MAVAVDTNPLVELLMGDPDVARRAQECLEETSSRGAIACSPVVYAELLALPGRRLNDVDEFLADNRIGVQWDILPAIWQRPGLAYQAYANRRRTSGSSSPRRLLADFIIGAQALDVGTLITRDADFYRTNFPSLRIIVP